MTDGNRGLRPPARSSFARHRVALACWAWFAGLAVLTAGPLLGSGWLLLLDYPDGPRFPDVSPLPLPSSGEVGNATPLTALLWLLRQLGPHLPARFLLLAPIVLGGAGVFRLARKRLCATPLAAVYGGTLYAFNPFVYDRLLAGQLFFLLAYGLLPWALAPLLDATRGPTVRAAVTAGLWLAVLGAADLHAGGAYAALAVAAPLFGRGRPRRRLAAAAGTLGLGALLSSFWLLPSLLTSFAHPVTGHELEIYASRPHGWGSLAALVSLGGFWRRELPDATAGTPALFLLLVPILALAGAGALILARSSQTRRGAVFLGAATLAGLAGAAVTAVPATRGAFLALVHHLPVLGVYREPQKLLALTVAGYALLGAVGASRARAGRPGRALPQIAALAGLAAALGYGHAAFWGFGGHVSLARYPPSWTAAAHAMDARGPGRMLALPWQQYGVLSFSDGRIVASPASSFFDRDVLESREPGFAGVARQTPDPFATYVDGLLARREQVRWLGHLLAPLGIRFVGLLREGDWQSYGFLDRQRDLRPLYRGGRIVVYENRAWKARALALRPGLAGDPLGLLGSARERSAASRLRPWPAAFPTTLDVPAPALRFGTERLEPAQGSYVVTSDRCTDGWRLGGERPICHLGAVAAFGATGAATLWRPADAVGVLGYLLAVLTLTGTAAYLVVGARTAPAPAPRQLDLPIPGSYVPRRPVRVRLGLPALPRERALRLAARVCALAGAASIVTIGYLAGSSGRERQAAPSSPMRRGVSCPDLGRAYAAYRTGDRAAFAHFVDRAANLGEETLSTTGQLFAAPEAAAVELRSLLDQHSAAAAQDAALRHGRRSCIRLGLWNPPGQRA